MKPQPNFNRVARIYRWAEYLALGRLLERVRLHFLPALTAARRAFILGDGDGRFTAALCAANRQIEVLAVDTSQAMLDLLHRRCLAADPAIDTRLHLRNASALDVTPPPATDLIVTHFFLDCLEQPQVEALAQTCAAYTAPGALWLVSDFRVPTSRWLRFPAHIYIRALYFAFRLLTGLHVQQLPDIDTALTHAGFERVAQHERLAGMLFTALWRRCVTTSALE